MEKSRSFYQIKTDRKSDKQTVRQIEIVIAEIWRAAKRKVIDKIKRNSLHFAINTIRAESIRTTVTALSVVLSNSQRTRNGLKGPALSTSMM